MDHNPVQIDDYEPTPKEQIGNWIAMGIAVSLVLTFTWPLLLVAAIRRRLS